MESGRSRAGKPPAGISFDREATSRGTGMRLVMLELMRSMARGAVADEVFADEFADEAAQADRMGDADKAANMRDLARRHRIKALEANGRLAAMRLRYAMMFAP